MLITDTISAFFNHPTEAEVVQAIARCVVALLLLEQLVPLTVRLTFWVRSHWTAKG